MMCFKRCFALIFVQTFVFGLGYGVTSAEQKDEQKAEKKDAKPKVVIVEGTSSIPLRVITRPNAVIYKEKIEEENVVSDKHKDKIVEEAPTFKPYYVYTRPKIDVSSTEQKEWYQIGEDNRGNPKGWIQAKDVMEWKQVMCMAYNHPQGRKRVLMFKDCKALAQLISLPDDKRIKAAEEYYTKIEKKSFEEDSFPIVAIEPEGAISMEKQFYLIPILEYAKLPFGQEECNQLKVAFAPKRGRGETGTLKNPEQPNNPESQAEILKELEIDIVYVIDMTKSMQPYIDLTCEALKSVSRAITQNPEIEKSIRFGLWGYQDSLKIKGLQFETKNFTEELLDVGAFENELAKVKVCEEGSSDYAEEVFAGIDKAMTGTKWTEEAMRIIILVGDAPGHEVGHEQNTCGQGEDTLRLYANDNRFTIFALHIKDNAAKESWGLAERQFRTLSRNRGLEGSSSYFSVDSEDRDGFTTNSRDISTELVNTIEEAKKGKNYVQTAKSSKHAQGKVKGATSNAIAAAMVDWISLKDATEAPRDIVAFVTDRDLKEPDRKSLEVRLFVNKRELDQLKITLSSVIKAGRSGQMTGRNFFESLQGVSATFAIDPEKVKNARSLAEVGLIPEFLNNLPYKSKIMTLTDDSWAAMSSDQQGNFLDDLDAKLKLYQAIHDTPNMWVQLSQGDQDDEHVFPISLDELP